MIEKKCEFCKKFAEYFPSANFLSGKHFGYHVCDACLPMARESLANMLENDIQYVLQTLIFFGKITEESQCGEYTTRVFSHPRFPEWKLEIMFEAGSQIPTTNPELRFKGFFQAQLACDFCNNQSYCIGHFFNGKNVKVMPLIGRRNRLDSFLNFLISDIKEFVPED